MPSSLSSSGSVDRCDGPSAPGCLPRWPRAPWPKQVSMRQKGKTKKKKSKRRGCPVSCVGARRGGRDDALVLVDTCCCCILQATTFSLLSSFFFSPLLVPHEVTETASKAQLVELQAAGWRAGTCLRPNADFLFTADTASRLRGCSERADVLERRQRFLGVRCEVAGSTSTSTMGGGHDKIKCDSAQPRGPMERQALCITAPILADSPPAYPTGRSVRACTCALRAGVMAASCIVPAAATCLQPAAETYEYSVQSSSKKKEDQPPQVPAKQNLLALAPAEGSMDGFGGPGKAMRIAEMGSIGGRRPGPSLTRTSRAGSWATLSANRSH